MTPIYVCHIKFQNKYVRVGILLTHGKHLHDRIISLRGDAWDHRTILTPPLYQVRKVSGHVFVLGKYSWPLCTMFIFVVVIGSNRVVFFLPYYFSCLILYK